MHFVLLRYRFFLTYPSHFEANMVNKFRDSTTPQLSLLYNLCVVHTALVCCRKWVPSALHGQRSVSTIGCLHTVCRPPLSLLWLRTQEKQSVPTSCRSPVPSLGFLPLYSTLVSLRALGASSLHVLLLNKELFRCSYW